jgi:hypothetical protein
MSRYSNTTGSNNAESDDDTSPEAIAKRLRDKIRLQAEALLSRCDESTSRSNISRHSSRVSTESMPTDGTSTTTAVDAGTSPVSLSSTLTPHSSSISSALNVSTLDVVAPTSISTPTSNGTSTSSAAVVTPSTLPKSYDKHSSDTTASGGNSSCCTTRSSSPSIVSSTSNGTSNAHDLTKRIQKLALERQQHPSNHLFNHDNNQQRLKIVQSDTSSHLSSVKTFEELNLPKDLLHAIFQMGFNRLSYIQEITLPRILQGRNVIGQAQSGSGKVCHSLVLAFPSL